MKNQYKLLVYVLIISLLVLPVTSFAYIKDETVYTSLRYNGDVKNTIVSNHIYDIGKEKLEEEIYLKNIINYSGAKNYKYEDNLIKWGGVNKDLYYEGNIEKKLPITFNIKYYLNGVEKYIDEIINK